MSGNQAKFPFVNGRRGIPDWVWAVVLAVATGLISIYGAGERTGAKLEAEVEARKAAIEGEQAQRSQADKSLAGQMADTTEALRKLTEVVMQLDQRVTANERDDKAHHENNSLHMPLTDKLLMFETKASAEATKQEQFRTLQKIEAELGEARVEQRAMREDIKAILRALPYE